MKLSEIRKTVEADPEILFADCKGNMLKVVSPVSDKYEFVADRDDKGWAIVDPATGRHKGQYQMVGVPPKDDPWATCSTGRRNQGAERGVLVEQWLYDENGSPTQSRGHALVKAKDIAGLWGDYMLLHSEDVAAKGRYYEARLKGTDFKKIVKKALADTGLKLPVGRVERYKDASWERRDSSKMQTGVHINEPAYLRDEPGLPVAHPFLHISANNEEDVEYLLEVLRLGVSHRASLAKRRLREAQTRAVARSIITTSSQEE